jgi:hypothetical protein
VRRELLGEAYSIANVSFSGNLWWRLDNPAALPLSLQNYGDLITRTMEPPIPRNELDMLIT